MSKASDKKRVLTVVTTIVGLGVSFVMVFPIIWLLMSSFKDSTELFAYPLHFLPENFSLDSYKNVIGSGFFQYVKNSLFLAVVGTLITLAISAMCGYGLAIYRHEIPYSNGLYNNIWGVILPVVTTTTGIFMYRQHFMSIPLSLAESARLDGAGEFKIFTTIMMPLASSVTVSLTIFSFVWRWNDYILPLMVLSDQKKFTIQIAIKSYIGTMGVNWNAILASSILSILPIIVIFIFLQKYITGGIATTGVKG